MERCSIENRADSLGSKPAVQRNTIAWATTFQAKKEIKRPQMCHEHFLFVSSVDYRDAYTLTLATFQNALLGHAQSLNDTRQKPPLKRSC
jgi:hypothetical protein